MHNENSTDGLRAHMLRLLEPDEGDPFNRDRSAAIDFIISTSSGASS